MKCLRHRSSICVYASSCFITHAKVLLEIFFPLNIFSISLIYSFDTNSWIIGKSLSFQAFTSGSPSHLWNTHWSGTRVTIAICACRFYLVSQISFPIAWRMHGRVSREGVGVRLSGLGARWVRAYITLLFAGIPRQSASPIRFPVCRLAVSGPRASRGSAACRTRLGDAAWPNCSLVPINVSSTCRPHAREFASLASSISRR